LAERRDGIEIRFDEYHLDLSPSDAHSLYAKRHETIWTDFVENTVLRADDARLITEDPLTKHDFAEKIRRMS
jgi:hypothetical protein